MSRLPTTVFEWDIPSVSKLKRSLLKQWQGEEAGAQTNVSCVILKWHHPQLAWPEGKWGFRWAPAVGAYAAHAL